jgi:2-polyprenyl-6-hydroxyphenyl methylase/3-demethylubiquinone-9 3-methyltransferase
MPSQKISRWFQPLRQLAATLLTEHLDPGHAAAAVFWGVFIANVPIYGFQTLAIIGLAALFRLNKPIAVAATFVNNPFLQPFLVVSAFDLGHFILTGRFVRFHFTGHLSDLKPQLGGWLFGSLAWLIGSLVMGLLLGAVGAGVTFLLLRIRSARRAPRRECAKFVNSLFAGCSSFDRGFVRWKMRLDRIFDILSTEELGSGPVVDLGCGYGVALGFAAFRDRERRLIGCDLDARRIAAARKAFGRMNAELTVGDVRDFEFPQAGLIVIFDVLQYLTKAEQLTLLHRCSSALTPGGKLIFRVPDRGPGLFSRLSVAFDRLIFLLTGAQAAPVVLSAEEYRASLEKAGLQVAQRRFRNRLPLAHLLFVGIKPQAAVNERW